ncbi:nuclear protein localization protein 4 (NPL4) family protein [Babesia bovis T2Bo]|uniref:NPL4 family protein n=1 Tax=Babesia bovis TaxID=5865 RepID=A7AUE8_BABBO|nr:nuclear protein localization protein 4 (NPL4) family protein [Babesia bovis T2Bo]EDO06559.1 nuclear protein localization protein 4 (NPL4) family protein [Babesia bovis T2Bo]|eukprot:XP_001610127.1 NPL4 family protein [Babesia bovis T2Bo]
MIIRVLSSIGISRISLKPSATLGDLKAEIRSRIQIPEGVELKFVFCDNNLEINGEDYAVLADLGIEHGTSLRLITLQGSTTINQNLSYVSMCKVDSPAEAPITSTVDSTVASPSVDKEETDDVGSSSHFKSFDAFLRDSGYPLSDLPLRQSYKPILIERGKMNKLPSSVTVKHQPYRHVDHIELMNVQDIHNFANYWMNDLEMAEQRAGWLYGYYVEDSHYPLGIRAVCEGIYEPPQHSTLCDVEFLPDEFISTVDAIAARLGLERIGHILTHLPRENYLSPQDVIDSAKVQLGRVHKTHYTRYPVSTHITCTLHPDSEGKPALNAFMVSDTAMALLRDGIIADVQPDPMVISMRQPTNKNEVLPQIIESGKEVTSFDPSWFVIRVNDSAPINPNSIFKYSDFPRENRTIRPITPDAVKKFFSSRLAEGLETSDANIFSDFHLLIYMARVLDVETALAICDALLGKTTLDPIMVELLMTS